MEAKEFNELTAKYVKEKLGVLGFKKSGVHHYIHESPNIMVFYKKTFRGSFEGFALALTHDFISNTKNDKGNVKIPVYLEDFPVSISIETLNQQYKEYKTSADFNCDMNFLTREVLTTRKYSNSGRLLKFDNVFNDDKKSEDYIKSSIEILMSDGMRFFNEFSPILSYKALTKYKNVDSRKIEQFKEEILEYLKENNIELPPSKKSWWKRIIN